MASKKLTAGDRVAWDTAQGETHGKGVKKLTSKNRVRGHLARAAKDDPQYLVESAKTGAKAAHKPEELKKR